MAAFDNHNIVVVRKHCCCTVIYLIFAYLERVCVCVRVNVFKCRFLLRLCHQHLLLLAQTDPFILRRCHNIFHSTATASAIRACIYCLHKVYMFISIHFLFFVCCYKQCRCSSLHPFRWSFSLFLSSMQ